MSRPLFFQRRFWPMWTALSLGGFTDNMLRQSLIIGIAFGIIPAAGFGGPEAAIPVIGSFFAISIFVFSAISGQIAEKYDTAKLFRRIKLVEVFLMASASIGFLLNASGLLIATLFAMGAQSAFFSPVRLSAMPKYLRADELVRGNGLCNAGLYVSVLMGLFLGGFLIAAPGGREKVAALLFCASLAGWLAIRHAPPAAPDAPDLKLHLNPVTQAGRIFRIAFAAPGVVRPMLGTAFFFYVSTFVTVLAPLYARDALGGDEKVATAMMGLFAIGAGVGATTAAGLSRKRIGLGVSAIGVGAASLMALSVFALTAPAAAGPGGGSLELLFGRPAGLALCLSFLFSAAAMGLYVVPLQAATQRRAPAATRGRIMAGMNMLNAAAAITGSLSVLAAAGAAFGPRGGFLLVAALQAAVAVYMFVRYRTAPAGLHETAEAPGEKESGAAMSSPNRA